MPRRIHRFDKRATSIAGFTATEILDRTNHTGTQAQSTIDGLEAALAAIESGKVEISSTAPVANQITIWEDPSTVAGDPNFTWDGSLCTVVGAVTVTDEVYGAGWDSSTEVPTKNALYDKIEAIVAATYTDEQAQDAIGSAIGAGTQTLITVTYQDVTNSIDFVVNESSINHDALTNFVANEHIDWTAASSAFVTSSTVTADDLLLYDTDASHTLTIHWNENEATSNRTLNLLVNGDSRFISIQGDLTVTDAASIEGNNTGDQTISLTGDVTGSGTGSFAATIANDAVTFAKMQNISTDRFLGRYDVGSGDVQEARFDGVTLAMDGTGVTGIVTGGVGNAQIRDAVALSVIGRASNSTGDVADIATSADKDVLRRSGTTLGFGKITTNSISTIDVADETADHSIVSGDEGTLFTDAGASSIITLSLPSPTNGMYFDFLVADGSGLRILALSGDRIYVGETATSTGGAISSTVIGSHIRLVGKGDHWFASYHSGAWSQLPGDSMLLRLEADSLFGLYNDGDSVAVWPDLTDNQNNGFQGTASAQPVLTKGGGGNGHASVTFDGSDDRIDLIDFSAESLTAAEAFLVVKIDTDPPGSIATAGLWEIGSDASANLYPFTDGVIYDGFGSTTRKTTVNPTPALTSWRIYSVYSASSDWQNYLDGTSLSSTGTNTVGFFSGNATLGEANGAYNLDGDISEFIVYSKKLSTNERTDAIAYLKEKYGIA